MDFVEQSRFFQAVFEIGRRYKILNPERMRSAYGKLVYFLMDSTKPDTQQLLQFDLVTPGAAQLLYRHPNADTDIPLLGRGHAACKKRMHPPQTLAGSIGCLCGFGGVVDLGLSRDLSVCSAHGVFSPILKKERPRAAEGSSHSRGDSR